MGADPRMELRALALWHTRRRMVDELLSPLLEYGPVAVERVGDRLDDLRELIAAEFAAFQAFETLVAQREQCQGVVVELFARAGTPDADRP